MGNKKLYLTPKISVRNLGVADIIRTSNENNDLEWDWDSEWGSLYNKTFLNILD